MSASPSPASPSSQARWFLPVLALLTVLGIVAAGAWLGREETPTTTTKTTPGTSAQPRQPSQADRSQIAAVQTPANTPAPQVDAPAAPPVVSPAPVVAAQTGGLPTVTASPSTLVSSAVGAEALTDPLSTEQALAPGEPARVRVSVGGISTPLLLPNQVGSFPRVYLPLGGQADVQVQLPEAAPGDQVVVAVEDGGSVADGKPTQALTLDDSHQAAFHFQASQSLGTFRVSVRHAAQTKIVTFWAGERAASFNY